MESGLDNDVIAACKDKLSQFRIKELKDVLTCVGLSKQGKKQDLVDRVLALLYDEGTPGLFKNNVNGREGLVEIIDDVYRKMQETGATDSNTKKQNTSGGSRMQPKEETEESYKSERKIRCPCGSTSPSVSPLVQCLDPDCNVWQHSGCVIIPENPMEKISIPASFLCEVCRLKRADPFWVAVAHPLYPVKLKSTTPVDGTKPTQSVETTFKITRADRDLVQKKDYDVQAWCMLFNDSVPFRVQWPQYPDLQVNGIPVRAVNRPGSQLLGANGRDDGAIITLNIAEGVNKISFSGTDARIFCLGVRLVKRRTLQQVLGVIPEEPHGEPFEDALGRVQRCIGGGMTTDNNDDDSDLEVIADSFTVNLRCPMSGSRMKTAGRFRGCVHMGCFDLETFVGLNERSRKWQCPICLKNYSLEDVVIDPFFNLIVNMLRACGEEINEIDMKPDGSWRVKNARQLGDLAQWHCPDGSLENLSRTEISPGNLSECNTSKLDVCNNVDGSQRICQSFMNQEDEVEFDQKNIITMSSTTTGNGKDDEEPSINQNDGEQFGVPDSDENEISSVPHGSFGTHEVNGQNSSLPSANADVIILSDSEDDDVSLADPATVPVNCHAGHDGYSLSAPAKILDSSPAIACGEGPCVFSENDYGVLNSECPFLSHSQRGSGIDFFGSSGAMLDEHNSASHSEPINCMLTTNSTLDPVHHVMESSEPYNSSFGHQFTSANGNISLEVPFPYTSIPIDELPAVSTRFAEDLISLRPEATGQEDSRSNVDACRESAGENVLDLQNHCRSDEDPSFQKTAGESGSRSGSGSDLTVDGRKSDGRKSNGPFSFPRHQRSVRKRSYQRAFTDPPSK